MVFEPETWVVVVYRPDRKDSDVIGPFDFRGAQSVAEIVTETYGLEATPFALQTVAEFMSWADGTTVP